MLPSIGAAPAASSPVAVLERKMLWNGGIITIAVPATAEEGEYPSDAGPNKFVRFAQNVKGGVVNFFVHDTEPTRLCGTRITAEVEVWQKTLADGREFLYVDLDPTSNAMPVMHRLAVMSCKASDIDGSGLTVFKTPEPLQGVVVVAPAESKIWIKAQLTAIEVKKTEPRITTGDSQLDRYLRDGWEIDCEDEKVIRLHKMKGDKRMELIHHRPQPRKKNHAH